MEQLSGSPKISGEHVNALNGTFLLLAKEAPAAISNRILPSLPFK